MTDNVRSKRKRVAETPAMQPTVERAPASAKCDLCGHKSNPRNPVLDVCGAKWLRLHAYCGLWISLAAKELPDAV